jgi:hypothetical protein
VKVSSRGGVVKIEATCRLTLKTEALVAFEGDYTAAVGRMGGMGSLMQCGLCPRNIVSVYVVDMRSRSRGSTPQMQ